MEPAATRCTVSISDRDNLRSSGGGTMDATRAPGVQQQIDGLPEAAQQHWQLILAHARSEPLAEAEALRLLHVCLEREATGIRLEWGSVCAGRLTLRLHIWYFGCWRRTLDCHATCSCQNLQRLLNQCPDRAACTAATIRALAIAQSGIAQHDHA